MINRIEKGGLRMVCLILWPVIIIVYRSLVDWSNEWSLNARVWSLDLQAGMQHLEIKEIIFEK